MTDEEIARLLRESHAALIVHAVNSLSTEFNCCPHTCAPCDALRTLHDLGVLDDSIRPYLKSSDSDGAWDWWDDGAGVFRWGWVLARWCNLTECDALTDVDDDDDIEEIDAGR